MGELSTDHNHGPTLELYHPDLLESGWKQSSSVISVIIIFTWTYFPGIRRSTSQKNNLPEQRGWNENRECETQDLFCFHV